MGAAATQVVSLGHEHRRDIATQRGPSKVLTEQLDCVIGSRELLEELIEVMRTVAPSYVNAAAEQKRRGGTAAHIGGRTQDPYPTTAGRRDPHCSLWYELRYEPRRTGANSYLVPEARRRARHSTLTMRAFGGRSDVKTEYGPGRQPASNWDKPAKVVSRP